MDKSELDTPGQSRGALPQPGLCTLTLHLCEPMGRPLAPMGTHGTPTWGQALFRLAALGRREVRAVSSCRCAPHPQMFVVAEAEAGACRLHEFTISGTTYAPEGQV